MSSKHEPVELVNIERGEFLVSLEEASVRFLSGLRFLIWVNLSFLAIQKQL